MSKHSFKEHSCSCDKCKNMCKKAPCLGTPEEMIKIAEAGYGYNLSESYWGVGIMNRTHNELVAIIAPTMLPNGCAFLNEDGLCILHDLNLKPLEGRLTNAHKQIPIKSYEELYKTPNYIAIKQWENVNWNEIKRKVFEYGK